MDDHFSSLKLIALLKETEIIYVQNHPGIIPQFPLAKCVD